MSDDGADSVPLASRAEPVLDYATRDADGLPTWHADAEAAIAQRCRPRAIRRFFRNVDEAVRYFAKSMRGRYGPDALPARCAACQSQPASFVLQVAWSATCPPRFLEFRLSEKEIAARFDTLHALCETCLSDWGKRLASYSLPRRWLARGMGVVTVVFVGLLLLSWVPAFRAFVPRWWTDMSLWFYVASLVVLSLAVKSVEALWRRGHPRILRRLMPRDVKLLGPSGAFARDEDGVLHSLTA
jgi:hypothetical protein